MLSQIEFMSQLVTEARSKPKFTYSLVAGKVTSINYTLFFLKFNLLFKGTRVNKLMSIHKMVQLSCKTLV